MLQINEKQHACPPKATRIDGSDLRIHGPGTSSAATCLQTLYSDLLGVGEAEIDEVRGGEMRACRTVRWYQILFSEVGLSWSCPCSSTMVWRILILSKVSPCLQRQQRPPCARRLQRIRLQAVQQPDCPSPKSEPPCAFMHRWARSRMPCHISMNAQQLRQRLTIRARAVGSPLRTAVEVSSICTGPLPSQKSPLGLDLAILTLATLPVYKIVYRESIDMGWRHSCADVSPHTPDAVVGVFSV